jgi:hypothetical protein
MSFTIYDATVPVFVNGLTAMRTWLDKAAAEKSESDLMQARLAPDMNPLPAQFQLASDTAKNAIGRLSGIDAPSMADTEASFAELRDRCDRTIAFIKSVDPAILTASADREVVVKLPNGTGWRFTGSDYVAQFALPNFFFHVTAAYAILRAAGVSLGKPDFLQHVGPPAPLDEA